MSVNLNRYAWLAAALLAASPAIVTATHALTEAVESGNADIRPADTHAPGTASLLLRRSYSHLSQPGGLIPLSREWLGGIATYTSAPPT